MLRFDAQSLILTNGLGRSGMKVGWSVCCGGSNAKWIRGEGLVAKTIHLGVNNEESITIVATATTGATTSALLT